MKGDDELSVQDLSTLDVSLEPAIARDYLQTGDDQHRDDWCVAHGNRRW